MTQFFQIHNFHTIPFPILNKIFIVAFFVGISFFLAGFVFKKLGIIIIGLVFMFSGGFSYSMKDIDNSDAASYRSGLTQDLENYFSNSYVNVINAKLDLSEVDVNKEIYQPVTITTTDGRLHACMIEDTTISFVGYVKKTAEFTITGNIDCTQTGVDLVLKKR